jgi:hypothetical protein
MQAFTRLIRGHYSRNLTTIFIINIYITASLNAASYRHFKAFHLPKRSTPCWGMTNYQYRLR